MTENPWKQVRPTSLAGGIRKMQSRKIRASQFEWDANYRRLLDQNNAEAERTIGLYNEQLKRADADILWTPLLIAAILAHKTWMHVYCPGCNTIAAVDLTMIRRPERTPLTAIAGKLKCERCRGQAATPRIVKLSGSHEL